MNSGLELSLQATTQPTSPVQFRRQITRTRLITILHSFSISVRGSSLHRKSSVQAKCQGWGKKDRKYLQLGIPSLVNA